jgi:ornithine cyclodeaminase/alanine dehydrogenase-like protein (mu-crystallin family)
VSEPKVDSLLVRRSEIQQILTWDETIEAVRTAFTTAALGRALTPASTQVTLDEHSLHIKAGGFPEPPVVTVKANLRPAHSAAFGLVLVFDQSANRLRAVLDSSDITAIRTAATAALAVQALAAIERPRVAILGAGAVGERVVQAVLWLVDASQLDLWTRSGNYPLGFAAARAVPVNHHDTPGAAVQAADVVITCTPAKVPFVHASDLREGVAVIALGADSPGKRELAADVLADALILADVRAAAASVGETSYLGAGAADLIYAEFGQVLTGQVALPKSRPRRIVLDSVGSSFVDAAIASVVVEQAQRLGLGTPFAFSS